MLIQHFFLMPALQNITNTNKLIEDKVNYFIDRFNHTNAYSGYEQQFEIETQLSLVEKIYYNLKSDSELRSEIFEFYFSHELLQAEGLWKDLKSYNRVLFVIKSFQSALKKDKLAILDKASFHQDLKILLDELKHKTSEILFKALMSIIVCKYPLSEHEHIAKLNTIARLIISESLFSGKTQVEISQAVSNIFTKEKFSFPFPNEVKLGQRKKFLSENNLQNQLSGFKSMMQPNIKSGLAIVRIYGGLIFSEDFEFKYDGVKFLGAKHASIEKFKQTLPDKDYFRGFFKPDGFIFAIASIQYFSYSSIRLHADREVSLALNYLNSVLGGAMQQEQADNYIVINSKWKLKEYNLSLFKSQKKIDVYNLRQLKDNPTEILKGVRGSESKDWFLSHEPLYVQVFQSKRISAYWQYLEALLPRDIDGKKQVKDLLSNLLLLNEKENISFRVNRALSSAVDFFNGGEKLFNIPFEKLHDAQRELAKGRIPNQIKNSKYPFVVELLNEIKASRSTEIYKQAKDYYYGILVEAYNVRNFHVHAGITNRNSEIKVLRALPRMIARLRWLIMDHIKLHPKVPFQLLISDLNDQANKMLDSK